MKLMRSLMSAGIAAGAGIVLIAGPASAGTAPLLAADGGAAGGATTPAAVAVTQTPATPFKYAVEKAVCGSGRQNLQIKQTEQGTSGTTHFKQLFLGQYYSGGKWHNDTGTRVISSTKFPNDGRSFTFEPSVVTYTYGSAHASASHRIAWEGQWLNSGNRAIALADITSTCA